MLKLWQRLKQARVRAEIQRNLRKFLRQFMLIHVSSWGEAIEIIHQCNTFHQANKRVMAEFTDMRHFLA
jgi:hypothetical protein